MVIHFDMYVDMYVDVMAIILFILLVPKCKHTHTHTHTSSHTSILQVLTHRDCKRKHAPCTIVASEMPGESATGS